MISPTPLPEPFAARIRQQLGDEANAFFQSCGEQRSYGLRLNRLKLSVHSPIVRQLSDTFGLSPVPWCPDGYFYDSAARPGLHPFHAAGLYYIQEPSAMIVAELLDAEPGDTILDLAAAPGGKTTQIAGRMQGQGLLIANEIHPARAKILAENVERMGIANAIVTQSDPSGLAARFPAFFDKIVLDAPCSGEGMFRKDPAAALEWSPEAVEACAARQSAILPHAACMLKPGGRLVYSTCTFNTRENEETIAAFVQAFPEFRLIREERMWPHRGQGEGHFAAMLAKDGKLPEENEQADEAAARRKHLRPASRFHKSGKQSGKETAAAQQALGAFVSFAREWLPGFHLPEGGSPLLFGESLYWLPTLSPESVQGLRTPRPGLHLGEWRKGRFEPAHALAMAVPTSDAVIVADYDADSPEVAAYLRGESTAAKSGECRGWGLMSAEGYPLGWFKAADGQQKNRLPKGLRLQR